MTSWQRRNRPGSAVNVPRPVVDPSVRLFVFHHAGGSHLLFRDWPRHFPADWEVQLLDAPGRGRLADEPACPEVDGLVEVFRDEVLLAMDRPYAFFGHSMGGLAAYELTNRLAAEGLPLPVWLGLSARGAPRPEGEGTQNWALPDDALRAHLAAMGGTPRVVLEDPDMWQILAPMIRGDLRLVEAWRPRPGTGPVPVPLSVFGGNQDIVVSPDRLLDWQRHATAWRGAHLFDGDHFYFQGDPRPLIDLMVSEVRSALASRSPVAG